MRAWDFSPSIIDAVETMPYGESAIVRICCVAESLIETINIQSASFNDALKKVRNVFYEYDESQLIRLINSSNHVRNVCAA